MTQGQTDGRTTSATGGQRSPLFGALVGLTTLVVLLQGVWAGIFLQRGGSDTWVYVHGVGAYVASSWLSRQPPSRLCSCGLGAISSPGARFSLF